MPRIATPLSDTDRGQLEQLTVDLEAARAALTSAELARSNAIVATRAKGVSQREIADACGLTHARVQQIERAAAMTVAQDSAARGIRGRRR